MRRPTAEAMRCATLTTCCDVAEPRVGLFQLAVPLDVNIVRPVDENVGDLVVVEKRFERTRARPCRRSVRSARAISSISLSWTRSSVAISLNELGDLVLQRRSRQPRRRRRVDPRHQQVPDPLLDVAANREPGSRPVAALARDEDKLVHPSRRRPGARRCFSSPPPPAAPLRLAPESVGGQRRDRRAGNGRASPPGAVRVDRRRERSAARYGMTRFGRSSRTLSISLAARHGDRPRRRG